MDITHVLIALIIVLALAVLMLSGYIIHTRQSLSRMLQVLDDIEKGNHNRKILLKDKEAIADIGYKINGIVDNYNARIIELKEAEKAYKQLLTSLSHDVRTPLTSLIGYLDAIHNEVVKGDEKDNYLDIARNKAYNLKEFVDILFEWFKLDSKERTFQFENTDINELTRYILTDWIPVFDKNRIAYGIHILDTECQMSLDPNAYTRIINNLIHNMLEHSGGDRIEIGVHCNNDVVSITVSDNGKGIENKHLPHVFDRLYKCDESRTHIGNGLGLAIVKELVSAHQGKISVSSIPNEKTTFTINLPLIKAL